MRNLFLVAVLAFSVNAGAEQSDVSGLLKQDALYLFKCTFDRITYLALYEDEAYDGPTEKTESRSKDIYAEDADDAVKMMLLYATIEETPEVKINPLSISCVKKAEQ